MSTSDNLGRQKALAIVPKFSAFLSALGSGFIVYDILCSHFNVSTTWWKKEKDNSASSDGFSRRTSSMQSARARSSRRFGQRKTLKNSAYYRLMLAMSCSDFIVSFAWFCTTWPIPKDGNSLDNPSDIVYGNIGNTRTCAAQAFFIQLGIVTPFYNALLACYYYLTIRREWKEDEFKCRIEYAGHFVSISFGFGTAVAGLVMELFNNSKVWCWIAPYPAGCGDGPDQEPCVRGINATGLRWAFYYGPLWVMIFLVGLFMTLVYTFVRGLDNKMDAYTATYRANAARTEDSGSGEMSGGVGGRGPGPGRRRSLMARTFSTMNADTINEQRQQRRNERSKAVANQGLFYAGTFALVWLAGTIVRAMQLAGQPPPWLLIFWFAVFTPSQGFFNFLVYVRPRLIKFLEMRKKARKGKRNSKSGSSSFNSDILHVSGISGVSSSNEVSGENQNQDASTRSDIDLSEPFTTERNAKVRFAAPDRNPVTDDKEEPEESEFQTKVRFVNDANNFNESEKNKDSEPANSDVTIPTVTFTLNKAENEGSTDLEISELFDDKTAESDETIDPDLLSSTLTDEEVEKVELPTAKEDGGEAVELHNATIDLATGEVRTRMAVRRVTPA